MPAPKGLWHLNPWYGYNLLRHCIVLRCVALAGSGERVFKILLRRREMYWSGLYSCKCGVGLV